MRQPATPATGLLRRAWRGWQRVGRKIADIQSRVLLTLVYFTVVAPFAVIVRATTDPLALKPATEKGWRLRAPDTRGILERARQQF